MCDVAAKSAALRTLLARQIPTRPRDHFHSGGSAFGHEGVACHNGGVAFRTGLAPWDNLAPYGGLRCGAIHELLFDSVTSPPKSLALLLARAAQAAGGGVIVWSDPKRELYPAAVSAAGIDLRRMILLRPKNAAEELSALAECLRCKGVNATVTSLNRLADIQARRLQLAAENGGGVGIFLRPILNSVKSENGMKGMKSWTSNYAAATRWMVRPGMESDADQSDGAQIWNIELLHGHGGRVGSSVLLEVDRETNEMRTVGQRSAVDVRASTALADRPAATPPLRATA